MAVKYSVAKLNVKLNGKSYEKVYAHAQVNETTSLKKFSQLIASQTTVSRADVSAVLISSVENLVMELQRGNQVEFGELGKFRLQLMSDGTETASEFTSDNIKGVRIQFVPGDDLSDMFNQMEFTPVASRLVQKAALKAEKTGAATVDIAEAKAAASKKNILRGSFSESWDCDFHSRIFWIWKSKSSRSFSNRCYHGGARPEKFCIAKQNEASDVQIECLVPLR